MNLFKVSVAKNLYGILQLIIVYKMFLENIFKGFKYHFRYVFVRGGLQAQAPAEPGGCERATTNGQGHFDTPVTTTKTKKRG